MQKIIAVLNNLENDRTVLERAVNLANDHNVLLEVLFIHEESLFDLPDYFLPEDKTESDIIDKTRIKKEIQDIVVKLNLNEEVAILLFIGDTIERVLIQTKDDKDALIVTTYHDKITDKLLKKCHLPLLVLKSNPKEYRKIILPVDMEKQKKECVERVKTLFSKSKIELLYDLRYVVNPAIMYSDYTSTPATDPIVEIEINQELKKQKMEEFEALKVASALEGHFIEEDLSVEDDLAEFIKQKDYDLVILCSHKKDFLLPQSISFVLLKRVTNDILIF